MFRTKTRYAVDTLGADVLRQVAKPIPVITEEIRQLAAQMADTMQAFDGIGLAAPQIGRDLRMVVLGVPADAISATPTAGEVALLPRMPLVLINPEIVSASDECCERDEGCLSVPDIFGPVLRPTRVVLRALSVEGEELLFECGGLLGRCIQHELDHLDGKLFIDRMTSEELRVIAADLRRLEKFGSKHHFHRVTTR